MFLAALRVLPNLRKLWITGSKVQRTLIIFSGKTANYTCTHLHFKLRIAGLVNFREFISGLVNLQVLDISEAPTFITALSLLSDLPMSNMFDLLKSNPLQALSLRRIQSFSFRNAFGTESYLPNWNITDIFSDYFKDTLTYLDLSQNSIQVLNRSFTIAFPQLQVLDLSQNLLRSFGAICELLVLHPSIEVIDLSGENLLDYHMYSIYPTKEDYLHKFNKFTKEMLISKRESGFSTLYLGPYNCTQGHQINDILTNHTIFAKLVNCQLKIFFNDSQDIPEKNNSTL